MVRTIGTQVKGIRAPIVRERDDLVEVVVNSLKRSWEEENYQLKDWDVVGITESLVARAQGNYVTIDDVILQFQEMFNEEIGVIFPILSRNRFSLTLSAIARACKKVYLLLSYPSDEVGNSLMDVEKMYELNINPCTDVLSEDDYRKMFKQDVKHQFTGVDYVEMYKGLAVNDNIEIYLSNDPKTILKYTKDVLAADIHTRKMTKKFLKKEGARIVLGLDDICIKPGNSGGYNSEYGLLGSNKASDNRLKLFPRDGQLYVDKIQQRLKELTGKRVEVMIFGDGAFKDPVGKIWELADPVVSPAFTSGLRGTPNEIKLKYIADSELNELQDEQAHEEMINRIKNKGKDLTNNSQSQGTTPRQLTDLLGSLCDLTSGSGDKGTPIVLIQGYFDNYASE